MNSKEKAFFIKKTTQKTANQRAQLIAHDDFVSFLQAKNILDTNIKKYTTEIEKFTHWLQDKKHKEMEACEKKDVLDFLQQMLKANLSASTRQHRLGMLNYYFTFLYAKQQISTNPTSGIKLRGTRKKKLQKILSIEEMEELLDTYFFLKVKDAPTGKHDEKGRLISPKQNHQRNHLILSLCIYQGLNVSEWRALKLSDIDLQKATINIQAQRQTNARILPLNATQIGIFYAYIYEARTLFNLQEETLFNPKLQTFHLIKELKTIYPKFEEFTQLRASIITHWIKTENLRKAQYKAGHRYISSTENYLTNDLESLQNDISRYHPI